LLSGIITIILYITILYITFYRVKVKDSLNQARAGDGALRKDVGAMEGEFKSQLH